MLRLLLIAVLATAALLGPLAPTAAFVASAAAPVVASSAVVGQHDHKPADGGCGEDHHGGPHKNGCCAACSSTALPPPTSPSFGVGYGVRVRLSVRVDSLSAIIHGLDPPVPRAAVQ